MRLVKVSSATRLPVVVVVYQIFLHGVVSADEQRFQLGDQRLFMSIEQRQDIDQQPVIADVAPEADSPTVEVIEKQAKQPDIKISLHGAVLRPEGSAILFMNNGTRNIASIKESQADRFSFPIKVNGKLVVLKPGQTVWVSNSSD